MDIEEEVNLEKRLAILKRSRTGKKGVITKRIQKLERLVSESGKKKIIRPLLVGLERVFNELVQVCNEITQLSDDVDPLNCLEDIRDNVEVCIIETRDHLEERKDEPDSSGSYTSSWVDKHAELSSEGTSVGLDDANGVEVDLVPKQEFFTPEGNSRNLATGFTNGGNMRDETDPPAFPREDVMENGAVDGTAGMSFDSHSLPGETAVPPAAEGKPDTTMNYRMPTPSTVESYALSDPLLDATVTGEEVYCEKPGNVENVHGDSSRGHLESGGGVDPYAGYGSGGLAFGQGLEPNPDVWLKTRPVTEVKEKELVSQVIVDSLSGKFRNLAFDSPDHTVSSLVPYDGGGTQGGKGDGVTTMTPMSSGNGSEQFWDSVWGTWETNATVWPGANANSSTTPNPVLSDSLLTTTVMPLVSATLSVIDEAPPLSTPSYGLQSDLPDTISGISGLPQVTEAFPVLQGSSRPPAPPAGTGTYTLSGVDLGNLGGFSTAVNHTAVSVVNQPTPQLEGVEFEETLSEGREEGVRVSSVLPAENSLNRGASLYDSSPGSKIPASNLLFQKTGGHTDSGVPSNGSKIPASNVFFKEAGGHAGSGVPTNALFQEAGGHAGSGVPTNALFQEAGGHAGSGVLTNALFQEAGGHAGSGVPTNALFQEAGGHAGSGVSTNAFFQDSGDHAMAPVNSGISDNALGQDLGAHSQPGVPTIVTSQGVTNPPSHDSVQDFTGAGAQPGLVTSNTFPLQESLISLLDDSIIVASESMTTPIDSSNNLTLQEQVAPSAIVRTASHDNVMLGATAVPDNGASNFNSGESGFRSNSNMTANVSVRRPVASSSSDTRLFSPDTAPVGVKTGDSNTGLSLGIDDNPSDVRASDGVSDFGLIQKSDARLPVSSIGLQSGLGITSDLSPYSPTFNLASSGARYPGLQPFPRAKPVLAVSATPDQVVSIGKDWRTDNRGVMPGQNSQPVSIGAALTIDVSSGYQGTSIVNIRPHASQRIPPNSGQRIFSQYHPGVSPRFPARFHSSAPRQRTSAVSHSYPRVSGVQFQHQVPVMTRNVQPSHQIAPAGNVQPSAPRVFGASQPYLGGNRQLTRPTAPPAVRHHGHVQQPVAIQRLPTPRVQQPVAQPQQLAARPNQSVIRQQQPVAQPQKLAARPNQPVIHQQQPVAQPQRLAARPNQPVIHQQQPVAQPQQLAARPNQPVIHPQQQVNQQRQSSAQLQQPVAPSQQPFGHLLQPAAQQQQSVSQPQSPVARQQPPVAYTYQPVAQPQHPVARPQQPAAPQQPPVVTSQPPMSPSFSHSSQMSQPCPGNNPPASPQVGTLSGISPHQSGGLPTSQQGNSSSSRRSHENLVDGWIDDLDVSGTRAAVNSTPDGISPTGMISWLVAQNLPKITLLTFDGSPLHWVEFIMKFRDVVHNQEYLSDVQRHQLLLQHLKDEAKKAVKSFVNDPRGYVLSLKRLKYLFGQRPMIARAVLAKVTKGKPVQGDDVKGVAALYYDITDCLSTLEQLNYSSDLYSSETLHQTVQRLPHWLIKKWAERSMSIRRHEEPNLIHLEKWLLERILVMKEACLSESCSKSKTNTEKPASKFVGATQVENEEEGPAAVKCRLCEADHNFWKCTEYVAMAPLKRFRLVSKFKICYNCLGDHKREDCSSKNTCFSKGCSAKHHTTLHDYFLEALKIRKNKRKKNNKNAAKNNGADNNGKDGANTNNKDGAKKSDKDGKDGKVVKKEDVKKGKNDESEECTGGDGAKETKKGEVLVGMIRKLAKKEVFLQIVPVVIQGPKLSVQTYGVLDTCAQATFVRDDIAKKLELSRASETILLKTLQEKNMTDLDVVTFTIASRDGKASFAVDEGYVAKEEKFNMPGRRRLINEGDEDMFTHLDDLDFDEVSPSDVTLLIGADIPTAHLCSEVRQGNKGQPLALKTAFGWCLFGNLDRPSALHCSATLLEQDPNHKAQECFWSEKEEPPSVHCHLISTRCEQALNDSMEKFWKQENCGILPPKDTAMSRNDINALKVLEDGTRNLGDRLEVPMLWAKPEEELPNNLPMAMKRYHTMDRRLRANRELHTGMQAVIQGYLTSDPPIARKMTPEEASRRSKRTWYLPIHPVTNPNKPGKIRVVNDAAAEYKGVSLNKSLLTGPDMLSSLVGSLLRFRTGPVALTADIEAMFHQVRVNNDDADSLRFLWKENLDVDGPPDTYQMLAHIFGASCSPTCCSYALKRAGRDAAKDFDAMTYESVVKDFYMDDLLKSVASKEAAIKLALETTSMLKRSGFRLCKFVSNSKEVLEALPPTDVSPSAIVNLDGEKMERALGVFWDPKNDILTFNGKLKETQSNKRGIQSATNSLFDPAGLLAPFTLKPKLLMQVLWKLKRGWDEIVDSATEKVWKKWLEASKKVANLKINRPYCPGNKRIIEVQLHVFGDASELAFGCVAYLRFSFKEGGHACTLVISKSRVTPLKTKTLPRLELDAALSGARISHFVLHEIDLPVERTQYWSDSTLTLQYINNVKHRMKVLVANISSEIVTLTQPEQWRHVPGKDNPADLLTRGVDDPESLLTCDWFTAPPFLSQDEEYWPTAVPIGDLDDDDVEIRAKPILVALNILAEDGINISKFSDWLRMRRVASWILRFTNNVQAAWTLKKKVPEVVERREGAVSVAELEIAEHFILKDVQQSSFEDEINHLEKNKPVPATSVLSSLSPFIDASGMLRVGGRLKNVSISPEKKHPPILPRSHAVTTSLLQWIHRKNGHVGPEHVLSLTREKYWVIAARVVINQVINKCFFCRVRRAKRMFPFMADLPQCRAAIDDPPFSQCGVDLCGPVIIKQGRKQIKRWVVLFTCLTIRCIHLEVVEDCETDAFINAVRRFVNRRGCPSDMFSDNGSNFKGACTELEEFVRKMDKEKITNFATSFAINWHFNPPAAPHMGGVWERLVRSVKEVMYGLVKDHILTDPQLLTLLTEAESIINSRPLTHLSEDVNDLGALTPNHILLGRHRNWASITNIEDCDINSRKKYKQVQAIANVFWMRWRREYLPTLMKRPKWRSEKPSYKTGELVLLQDDDVKRGKWPLARITKVMPGPDDVVRTVEVRTKTGIYTRPVAKLLKLEDNMPSGNDPETTREAEL